MTHSAPLGSCEYRGIAPASVAPPCKVLFVDDEPIVLRTLERLVRMRRPQYQATFATSATQALERFAADSFDIVVSDMQMPEIDGATFLTEVQDRFPQTVRIVLSGNPNSQAVYRLVPVAHHFVSKPFDIPDFLSVLDWASHLRTLLTNEELRAVIGKDQKLPTLPRLYRALISAMRNPDVDVGTIAPIIESDLGMSAKLLSLANSAFFGRGLAVTSVKGAICHLGMNTIKELVLSVEVFRLFEDGIADSGISLEALQRHAVFVGDLCKRLLVTKPELIEWASLAASLHDIGKLIMASRLPSRHAQALRESRERGCSFAQAEHDMQGVTHAQLGAYLLGLWGFPYAVVDCVAGHHGPFESSSPKQLDTASAVAIADMLALEVGISADPQATTLPNVESVNMEYIRACGLEASLPLWRKIAKERADTDRATGLHGRPRE